MHAAETMRDTVLPPRKKTTSLRALTIPLNNECSHYLPLLTLSLASISLFHLSVQTCQNTKHPPPTTSHIHTANASFVEAFVKLPAITTLAITMMIMTGISLSALMKTTSFRKLHNSQIHKMLRAHLSYQSIQHSVGGTQLSQLNNVGCKHASKISPQCMMTTKSTRNTTGPTVMKGVARPITAATLSETDGCIPM